MPRKINNIYLKLSAENLNQECKGKPITCKPTAQNSCCSHLVVCLFRTFLVRGYASVALQKCHRRHIFEQERVIIRLIFLKILVTGVGKRLGRDGVPRSDV